MPSDRPPARTTVRLDPALLRAAKKRALDTGTTLTRVLEDALRRSLAKPDASSPRPVPLPRCGGQGLRPGVSLDHNAELIEVMERQ